MILCVSLCESCWLVDKLIGVLLLTGYLPYETALPPNIERVDAWKKKSLGSTRRCVSAQKSGNLVGRRPFDLFTFSHKSEQLNCVRSHGYANFCVWFDWDGDTHTEFFSVCDDHSGRRWQNKSIIIRYWLKYCQFSFCRLTHAIRAQWPFSHQSHEKRSKAHTHTRWLTSGRLMPHTRCIWHARAGRANIGAEWERYALWLVSLTFVLLSDFTTDKNKSTTHRITCAFRHVDELYSRHSRILFVFIDSQNTKHFHNLMRTQRMMRTATDIVDTKNNGLPIDWVSCGRTLNRRGREKNNNEVSSGHNKWQSNLLCFSLRICFFSNPVEALLCHWHSLTYHRGQCRIRNWTCARARAILIIIIHWIPLFCSDSLATDFCRKTIVPNAT